MGTLFDAELHGIPDHALGRRGLGIGYLEGHDQRIRGNARLGACRAVAGHGAGAVGAMTVFILRIVVVEVKVPSVVRIFLAFPHVVGKVEVVVVDARIDHRYDDALAGQAQGPHVVGIDLGDVPGDLHDTFAALDELSVLVHLRIDHCPELIVIDRGHPFEVGYLLNGCRRCLTADDVGYPESLHIPDRLGLGKEDQLVHHRLLRGGGIILEDLDDLLAPGLLVHRLYAGKKPLHVKLLFHGDVDADHVVCGGSLQLPGQCGGYRLAARGCGGREEDAGTQQHQ